MIIEDIINEKCVTFMTEEPMDNIQSAEYFKENILPNEVEITHDDGNYFEVSVNCKSYSCDVYGKPGDFSDSDKKCDENFGIDYIDVEDLLKL